MKRQTSIQGAHKVGQKSAGIAKRRDWRVTEVSAKDGWAIVEEALWSAAGHFASDRY